MVGFEVNPRSISKESVQEDEDRACAIPSEAKVMEIKRGSESCLRGEQHSVLRS